MASENRDATGGGRISHGESRLELNECPFDSTQVGSPYGIASDD